MTDKKRGARPGAPLTNDGERVSGNGNTVNIAVYHHEKFGDLRVTDREGKPWFVAQDVARSLGYTDTDKAIRAHCRKTKTCSAKLAGQVRHLKIINESDTLRLVMRSRTPKAVEYQDWVVEEVLPSIHRTGVYIDPKLREGLDSAAVNSIFEEMMRPDAQMIRRAERRGARMGVKAFLSLSRGARSFNADIYDRLTGYYSMGLSYKDMSVLLEVSESSLRRWVSKMVLAGMVPPRVKAGVR